MGRPPGRPPGQRNDAPVEVVWEAPPDPKDAPTIYDDALEEVKGRAGSWARIRLFETQSPGYNSRKRLRDKMKDPRWEFTVAKIPGRNGAADRFGLWARYRTPEQMEASKK